MREPKVGCRGCRDGELLPFDFTMAFHPIVDVSRGTVWGYEALVRGTEGQSAGQVLGQVTDENRYKFDQACRVKAIGLAGRLFPANGHTRLSINFMPNAVYEPSACIKASLAAAARVGFRPERIMFEFTENEEVGDPKHLQGIVAEYKRLGFLTAIDDFGAGHAGLNLLAKFQPDVMKIDMELIRGIEACRARQAIVAGIVGIARTLNVIVIAEGVETREEATMLRSAGITLLQGYLFAKPEVEHLPELPGLSALADAA